MGRVIIFSLSASLNPTLVAATTLMMLLPSPAKLMVGYLCGALLTSITLGLLIVSSFSGSEVVRTTQHAVNPIVDIVLGALALVVATVLSAGRGARDSGREDAREPVAASKPPPRWQRELRKGSPRVTFIVGALLTLPGASYLAGLRAIHNLHYSTAATVLSVVGFNAVMLWLLEVPLISFVIAPEWTPRAIERSKLWVGRHARTFAIRCFATVGILLIAKGIVGLLN